MKQFDQDVLAPGQILHTDAFASFSVLAEKHQHIAWVTPPEMANE